LIQETSEGSRDATATGRRRSQYARSVFVPFSLSQN
jgi:hypothetical protein